MGSEVIILPAIMGVIFGIFYLFISARNKERMALIEKGADASIFYGKRRKVTAVWKIIFINLALLLMGVGLAIFIAAIMHHTLDIDQNIAYPGTIFFMSGLGLFAGIKLTNSLINED